MTCDVNDSLDGSDVMIAKMKSAAELRESDAFVIFAPFALCILLLRNNLRWGACKGFGSCRPFSRLNTPIGLIALAAVVLSLYSSSDRPETIPFCR